MNDYYNPDTSDIDYKTFGGDEPVRRTRKQKFRDAITAASKYKQKTDYKARREAEEKKSAQRATMKVAPDISVLEGYTDPGFVIQGQEGTRGGIFSTVGRAVGGYFGGPLGGQVGGMVGGMFA